MYARSAGAAGGQRPPGEAGAWSDEAVHCVVSVLASASDPGHADSCGAIASRLDALAADGISCLRLVPVVIGGPPVGPATDHPSRGMWPEGFVAGVQDLTAAATRLGMRVLLDVGRRPAHSPAEWHAQLEAGRFWCGHGVDGVVLPTPAISGSPATMAERAALFAHPSGDPHRDKWFLAVDGVPVPVGMMAETARQRALFRARLLPALLEGLRLQTGNPLLGLVIRLAIGIVREGVEPIVPFPAGSPAVPPIGPLLGLDPRRLELIDRLLLALPGPPQIVMGEGGARTGTVRLRTLIGRRRQSAALTRGTASPISLGAGPTFAVLREAAEDAVLVVGNLSDGATPVACDLTGYEGWLVVDMVQGCARGRVTADTVRFGLPPYGCEWLRLVPA
jgi:hypothetical protein